MRLLLIEFLLCTILLPHRIKENVSQLNIEYDKINTNKNSRIEFKEEKV